MIILRFKLEEEKRNVMKRYVSGRLLNVVPSIVTHRDELVSTKFYRRLRSRGHARFSRDFRSFVKALSLISFLLYLYRYIFLTFCSLNYLFPGALMYLNEATLLNNIRTRYFKDRIYVSNYTW